eukprot:2667752-Alexandrium_andersonii.AAC.1
MNAEKNLQAAMPEFTFIALTEAWRRLEVGPTSEFARGRIRIGLCCGSSREFEQYRRLYRVARYKCSLPRRPCRPLRKNMLPGVRVNVGTAADFARPFPRSDESPRAGHPVYELDSSFGGSQPSDGRAA